MGLISSIYGNKALRPANQGASDSVGWKTTPQHLKKLPDNQPGIVWLRVPFEQRNEAKALGARWHPQFKFWYAKIGPNTRRFERWIK